MKNPQEHLELFLIELQKEARNKGERETLPVLWQERIKKNRKTASSMGCPCLQPRI